MINTTDGTCTTNRAYLWGEAADNLRLSHKTYGEAFLYFFIYCGKKQRL